MPAIGLDHDPPKRPEVLVRAEQAHAADGAVEDVVDLTSGGFAGCSRHESEAYETPAFCQTSCVPVSAPVPVSARARECPAGIVERDADPQRRPCPGTAGLDERDVFRLGVGGDDAVERNRVEDPRREHPAIHPPRRQQLEQLARAQGRAAGGVQVTVDRGEEETHGRPGRMGLMSRVGGIGCGGTNPPRSGTCPQEESTFRSRSQESGGLVVYLQ